MKKCNKCILIKSINEFSGKNSWCNLCKRNYINNKRGLSLIKIEREELFKLNKKRCTYCNEIKFLEEFSYNKTTKDKCTSKCLKCRRKLFLEYKILNLQKCIDSSENYRKNNLGKDAHKSALRRARKLQRTPKWLTEEQLNQIKQFYINCPKGHEVDHIIPLIAIDKSSQEVVASGLHVPWNLQYLTVKDNRSKNSYITIDAFLGELNG